MYIKTPTHWRSALSAIHRYEEADLLVSVVKDTLAEYHYSPDQLEEGKVVLEQLAEETLKMLYPHAGVSSKDLALVRDAIGEAAVWAMAEAALEQFCRKLGMASGYMMSADMVSSDHAVVRAISAEPLQACLDVFWANGQWHISGAHVDAKSLERLTQKFQALAS